MKIVVLFNLLFLICIGPLFSQTKITIDSYDFDLIKTKIEKTNLEESERIKEWIISDMTLDYVNICTKLCASYLSDIPDDIELMNEEIPGTLEREFKSKWKDKFDMNRIPGVHPFEIGNGGCSISYAKNVDYLGMISNEYYFNTTIFCDLDDENNNKLILKIIKQNNKYLIDNVMSQTKYNYFEGY